MTDRERALAQLSLHRRKQGVVTSNSVVPETAVVAQHRSLFPKNIETGEKAEDALPHLFDVWDFDKMPKFDHAVRYVQLNYVDDDAQDVLDALANKEGEATVARCDDLLRACRLYPAPIADPLVREHMSHVTNGKKFKPACMVMFRDGRYGADLIDGYHRVSSAWWWDAQMPCPVWRIVI